MTIDLHMHTTVSDGQKSANEIIDMAAACGVSVLAITNHDTEESMQLYSEYAHGKGIKLMEGIELSAFVNKDIEVHLLGYHIDSKNPPLAAVCKQMLMNRKERFEKIIALLQTQGIEIAPHQVKLGDKGLASRMHIAYTLAEKGYAPTATEALEKYLSPGCRAYIANEAPAIGEAVSLIKNAGGVPVLAHPFRYKIPSEQVELLIKVCIGHGVEGLEVFYPTHSQQDRRFLLKICDEKKLVPTCGTDYHKGSAQEYMQRLKACEYNQRHEKLEDLIDKR